MGIFGDYKCATTDIEDLNTINKFELTFTEHSAQQQQNTHSFLKCIWNIYQIDHVLSHKTNLNTFKGIRVI